MNQAVVLDPGSGVVKAGFAGSDEPQCVFNSVVGRPKHQRAMVGAVDGDLFVGSRAESLAGLLRLRRPISRGAVVDWTLAESMWRYLYSDLLRCPSEEHPVLVVEPPLNQRSNRERLAEFFFEKLGVPALFFSPPVPLCLYATGRTTGIVLDCGAGQSHCGAVVDGFALQHSVLRSDVGGQDVTERLASLLLRGPGLHMSTSSEMEVVRRMKEDTCYVAVDPAEEELRAACKDKKAAGSPWGTYKLPDGSAFEVGPERFRAPEVLFRPDLSGSEQLGVHELVESAICRADVELRPTLYANIVLAGGTTVLPEFGKRLLSELKCRAPKDTKIRIIAPPERQYSAWIGGSLLASLAAVSKMWITKSEFDQTGVNTLHKRCF